MHTTLFRDCFLKITIITSCLLQTGSICSQSNLLLNGGFEDINTCTEYESECGVEGWFYLKDVKAQMISNENASPSLGGNSFGLYFNWNGYTDFSPLLGTLLPCQLQKGKQYTFKGMVSAKLNPRLILVPGITIGEKFYVPKRPFSAKLVPDRIISIQQIPQSNFYSFEYNFTATGKEKYLTFGTFIKEDTVGGKKSLIGIQTVSVLLDNFQLLPSDINEVACADWNINKEKIYRYNFRHKEMDYSLFGKGELNIPFDITDVNFRTQIALPTKKIKADTLKLGDVFFDFNKANLKTGALKMLESYFLSASPQNNIDSIYIEGHTDSIGTDARNLQLSLQRCQSVEKWLHENLSNLHQIQIRPFGKTKPIASNSTSEGRALNRRVEMIVFRRPLNTP
jgi:outer membrane protein OmpA-like peptidoglycan-associated protein